MNDDQLRIVQLFTGSGKGKTSAAIGSVMRASGYGLKTFVASFGSGTNCLGKYRGLTELANVDCCVVGEGGPKQPEDIGAQDIELGRQALDTVTQAVTSGEYDLVVLDDISKAVSWNIIDKEGIARLVREKPADVELILTGEDAPHWLIALADMVTEIEDGKKH
jgi:cob(I)alamin adenosyltransferase